MMAIGAVKGVGTPLGGGSAQTSYPLSIRKLKSFQDERLLVDTKGNVSVRFLDCFVAPLLAMTILLERGMRQVDSNKIALIAVFLLNRRHFGVVRAISC
jgi:hypothetical protein